MFFFRLASGISNGHFSQITSRPWSNWITQAECEEGPLPAEALKLISTIQQGFMGETR